MQSYGYNNVGEFLYDVTSQKVNIDGPQIAERLALLEQKVNLQTEILAVVV
ncbi:MAG: hypothetical protein V3T40_01325 [Nitrososphaerales archaeon]